MTASYLSLVGENLTTSARMIGLSRLAGLSRVIGRAAGAAGIAYVVYEAGTFAIAKNPSNPALKKLAQFQAEREKWQGMVSCLGREPYEEGKVGSIDEGGAINALYPKTNYGGQQLSPNKAEARALVERCGELLETTVNQTGSSEFDAAKQELCTKLDELKQSLASDDPKLAAIQREISTVVALIKPIESSYIAKAYELAQNAGSV